MAKILDGKSASEKILREQASQVRKLASNGVVVGFAMLSVGEDPSVMQYAMSNKRAAEKLGIISTMEVLPDDSTTEDVLQKIYELNDNHFVNAILMLMPMPEHIDAKRVVAAISAQKDIDGQTPQNIAALYTKQKTGLFPCTPLGAMRLLDRYNISLDGKNVVVIGRSPVVGKPIAIMLLNANATVTICHTHTRNLKSICRRADIIVACAGSPKLLKADMVNENTVVLDMGTNFVDGKLCGDVDFEAIKNIAAAVSPVPGGCGPMTVAAMMENIVMAAKMQNKIK